jgi:hypothetical protein
VSPGRGLLPKEIVDIAEVALRMGLVELGQKLLDAAYDVANGVSVEGLEDLVQRVAYSQDLMSKM